MKGEFCSDTGETFAPINLSGTKEIEATKACAQFNIKDCENLAESTKDTNLCKDVLLTVTGYKQGTSACRSENNKGEKDPVETILALLDLHLSSEETAGKVLQPLLLADS